MTSMVVSILTHIKYSKCGWFEIETKEPEQQQNHTSPTPSRKVLHTNMDENDERRPLMRPRSKSSPMALQNG